MPDLLHSLHNYDIGHLRIVAGRWGVELSDPDQEGACRELSAALLDPDLAAEYEQRYRRAYLPDAEQKALSAQVRELARRAGARWVPGPARFRGQSAE